MKSSRNPLALGVRLRQIVMKMLLLLSSVACTLIAQGVLPQVQPIALTDERTLNVNARYTVESVQVVGWRVKQLSDGLRTEIGRLTGEKLDHPRLDTLAQRIKTELHVGEVTVKVAKGDMPGSVEVTFEIPRSHQQDVEFSVAKFLYHSQLGWSGEGSATTNIHGNTFTFGLVSDADTQLERFAGIRAGFERRNLWADTLGQDRLGVRFDFASYHDQWNTATLSASPDETYRTRTVFEPQAHYPADADTGARSWGPHFALSAGCAGREYRVLQRGGIYSALPPALGIG